MSEAQDRIVDRLSAMMKTKLNMKAGQNTRHWRHCSHEELLVRLREEVVELEKSLTGAIWTEDVLSEAADVANFAAMIADNFIERHTASRQQLKE